MTARLAAFLSLDSAEFSRGIKRAEKDLNKFANGVIDPLKKVGAGFAVVTAGLGALAIKQASVIDETSKLASSLGVGLKEFQSLALVADEAGVAQDQLTNAFAKTQKAVFEAANGNKTYADTFSQLGLKANDLISLSADQQFLKIADSLSAIENPTKRTAIALEIFGKNGRAIIGLLPDLAEKQREAAEFQERFNIAISEIDASKVEEANDAFGRVLKAISGIGNTIAVEFAPFVTLASEALLNAGIDGKTFSDAIKDGMSIAALAIDGVRKVILSLQATFNGAVIAISDAVVDLSVVLFDLGNGIAKTLSLIPGVSLEAEDALLEIGLSAKKSGDEARKSLDGLARELETFETTALKIERAQVAANKRAQQVVNRRSAISGALGSAGAFGEDEVKSAGKEVKNFNEKVKEAKKSQIDLNDEISKSFSGISTSLAQGAKASDVFKTTALNAINQVSQALINNVIDKSFSGGSFGGVGGALSGLAGSVLSGLGGFIGKFLPSFDVGSFNVPRDMVANIHKGEMIIPAREASAIRAGGVSGATVIQNISIGAGVSATVRQEVLKMLPELKKATVDAVQDSRLRGASI